MSASAEERMKKAIDNLSREFAKVRTGQANPAMLDAVMLLMLIAPVGRL